MIHEVEVSSNGSHAPTASEEKRKARQLLQRLDSDLLRLAEQVATAEARLSRSFNRFRSLRLKQRRKQKQFLELRHKLGLKGGK